MGSLIAAIVFMTWLMLANLKMLRATKQQRLEARRAEKRAKNERLRRAFNLPED